MNPLIFLMNLFAKLEIANKLGTVTELLRGPGPQPPNGARGTATPIFGPN